MRQRPKKTALLKPARALRSGASSKGFTNKEIANHFCLSEQTVKNHLYHSKHKIGAEDRLNIVERFRSQGFLL